MNSLAIPLLIIIMLVVVAATVLRKGSDAPAPGPAPGEKGCMHGNSALAGGHIEDGQVRFYVPSPVQLLRDRLPGVELVDCIQNGLALTEALRGGPVRMDNPALGGTRGTCEAIAEIWARERPTWAYVALLEVEPLFWPEFDLAQLLNRLDELKRLADRCGVRLVLQGPIHFAVLGPVTEERLRLLTVATTTARNWAEAFGVAWVDLQGVPFDPAQDVCADNLHPTMARHVRYADARAQQLQVILANAAAWRAMGATDA